MKHIYKIFELKVNTSYAGYENIVVGCKVHVNSSYEYTKTEGEHPHTSTVDTYRLLDYDFDIDSLDVNNFIDFESLTEEIVLSWIPQSDKDSLETEIEIELNEAANKHINWDKLKSVVKQPPW
jgi:hypothetical protein